jgi:hypothetical protein
MLLFFPVSQSSYRIIGVWLVSHFLLSKAAGEIHRRFYVLHLKLLPHCWRPAIGILRLIMLALVVFKMKTVFVSVRRGLLKNFKGQLKIQRLHLVTFQANLI